MYSRLSLLVLFLTVASTSVAEEKSVPKTYRNPLLQGSADPDVLEFDGTYYLYPTYRTSGYDVWVSKNLADWKHEGRVFNDPRGGAWAPDVFYHKSTGKFYLYYTDDDPADPNSPLGK